MVAAIYIAIIVALPAIEFSLTDCLIKPPGAPMLGKGYEDIEDEE